MSRSKWKFILKNTKLLQGRQNLITPNFINKTVKVHNGKQIKNITIVSDFIGHKFGEFVYTKVTPKYKHNVK